MPRRCTVCDHPKRAEIDNVLVNDDMALRTIADRFGLSHQAVIRHRDYHLPVHLVKAQDAAEMVEADNLLDRLRHLNAETLDVLKVAKDEREHELRLKAIARAEKQIELEGRLLGELADQTTVNVLISPEWLTVRTRLLQALVPFPEARDAVVVALGDGSNG